MGMIVNEGREKSGAVLFSLLLNLKHIFLYYSPIYFFHLLSHYCLHPFYSHKENKPNKSEASNNSVGSVGSGGSGRSGRNGVGDKLEEANLLGWKMREFAIRLIALGFCVLLVFFFSFANFYEHIPQILSRLFPWGRGLLHAYWAPNFWALYTFGDKMVFLLVKKVLGGKLVGEGIQVVGNMSRGVVGESGKHLFLPPVLPLHTFLLTLFAFVPIIWRVWKGRASRGGREGRGLMVKGVAMGGFVSFMFGWHVHEKAISMVLIPLSLLSPLSSSHSSQFFFLSTVSSFSLFPLLFQSREFLPKVFILLSHSLFSFLFFSSLFPSPKKEKKKENGKKGLKDDEHCFRLNFLQKTFLVGIFVLEIYNQFFHNLFFSDSLPFLPLLLTSVFCSLSMTYSFCVLYFQFVFHGN